MIKHSVLITGLICLLPVLAGCSKADEPAEMINLYTGTVNEAEILRCQANLKQLTTSATILLSQSGPDVMAQWRNLSGTALLESVSNSSPVHMPAKLLSCTKTGARYRGPADFNTFMKITGGGTETIAMCPGCGNILQGGGAVVRAENGSPQYQQALDATVE
ncbi:MAG: hypothetical protein AB1599_03380 [Planctomycetota bacterium]